MNRRQLMNEFRRGQDEYDQLIRNINDYARLVSQANPIVDRYRQTLMIGRTARLAEARFPPNSPARYRYQAQIRKANADIARLIQNLIQLGNRKRNLLQRIYRVFHQGNVFIPGGLNAFVQGIVQYNPTMNVARLKHVLGTRLAGAIERSYTRPGGMYSRKLVKELMNNNSKKRKRNNNNSEGRPKRNNYNSNEAFNKAMNNWTRRGRPGSSKN